MPYVISTKRRNAESAECGGCGQRLDDGSVCEQGGWLVSRHAVATLEEAREIGREMCNLGPGDQFGHDHYLPCSAQFDDLPESGGTVGPLPDGTVIEVEQLSPLMLSARIPGNTGGLAALIRDCLDKGGDWTELLRFFNARQS